MTERLYYADSFCTTFEAIVTDIQELSRADGKSLWRLALDRSAFYPTSGGQPFDTGTLIATARSGAELTAEIIGVEEEQEGGRVWHHTAKPLLPGTPVRGVVDRDRRLDHMQQHSGQHLLSAAFLKICGAATVSFHLGDTTSTIDLAVDALPEDTLRQVAELANRVLAEDRSVDVTTVSRSYAETLLAHGELRKLPPRAGDLRIIEISDFDRNPCGGTHVRSTGQIGGLHLRGAEKVKQGIRVEFVCGMRSVRAARSDFLTLTESARQLSAGLAETPEAIARLLAEAKSAAKQIQALTGDLLRYRAEELVRLAPAESGVRVVYLLLAPPDAPDAGYAKLLASKLAAAGDNVVALIGWQTRSGENGASTVIIARSRELAFDCGMLLKEALNSVGGRGGGSRDMAQGSVPAEHLSPVLDGLRERLLRPE
jgi:alanyl-tRNA synthetase